MTRNIKRILFATLTGCVLSTVTSHMSAADQQKSWFTWKKACAIVGVAGICAWIYLDSRMQNLLTTATLQAQKQFIEDLKVHAPLYGEDLKVHMYSYSTVVPGIDIIKNNTIASLKSLNIDFKSELLFYQISSKLCALIAALGLYGYVQSAESTQAGQQ